MPPRTRQQRSRLVGPVFMVCLGLVLVSATLLAYEAGARFCWVPVAWLVLMAVGAAMVLVGGITVIVRLRSRE